RRLVGRAAEVCTTMADFRTVRRPLRDTLVKAPKIGGLSFPSTQEAANTRMAEILRDRCLTDVAVGGGPPCPAALAGYAKLCDQPETIPKQTTSSATAQVRGKADAGSVKEARAEAARESEAVAARLAANKQADAGGCAVMKEISARYPPAAAGPSGSGEEERSHTRVSPGSPPGGLLCAARGPRGREPAGPAPATPRPVPRP